MPSAFSANYDDAVPGEKAAALRRCEAARDALLAAGLVCAIRDDPPWTDAGNLSGYFQDCSGGSVWVDVDAEHVAWAKSLLAPP